MNQLITALKDLIGRNLEYEGESYRVIDVLAEGPTLVLHMHNDSEIQSNQYGEAQRRAPKTRDLPLCSENGKNLHPMVVALLDDTEEILIRSLVRQ